MTLLRLPPSPAAGPAATDRLFRLAVAVAAILIAAPVLMTAGSARAGDAGVTIHDPWMRLIIPSRPAAGYFTLRNATDKPASLVAARSAGCAKLMLHRSVHQNGQDRMVMVKNAPVPAHGTLKFAPGGYHLMCMKPTEAVRPGKSVKVTLSFADGSSLEADFPVKGVGGK